jgi:acetyl-CoA acetyltransferase
MSTLQDAVLVAARRSAVGRALKGTLRNTRPDDLAIQVLRGTLADVPGLPLDLIDDVVLGCAMPEGEQGLNVARIVGLRAGLPNTSSAQTINRFCASGLQAIATCAERIRVGAIEAAVASGYSGSRTASRSGASCSTRCSTTISCAASAMKKRRSGAASRMIRSCAPRSAIHGRESRPRSARKRRSSCGTHTSRVPRGSTAGCSAMRATSCAPRPSG